MRRNAKRLLAVLVLLFAAPAFLTTVRAAQQDKPEPPKIIRKSGGVLQGTATRRVEPSYPPLAKTARISGAVVVEVTVGEDGSVISARAVSGHPLLKDAAVNAARGWVFTPTVLEGRPVKVIGTITFNFMLDYSKDIERLKQQIAEKPNDAELYAELGEMYINSGQNEEALGAYRQALVLEPNDFESWMGIGNAEARLGHLDAAVDAYKQAAQHPVADNAELNATAFTKLGAIYFAQQRYQETVQAYKQAAEYDDDLDTEDYVRLATAYVKLGDKESAMAQYRKLKNTLPPEYAERLLKQINDQQ
jgi:TonB family protein